MRKGYPNLELIEYKCKTNAYDLHDEILKDSVYNTFKIDTFMQTWANTSTGFDMEGYCSGQAFTEEYTTVCEMSWNNRINNKLIVSKDKIYGVFFGNNLAYMLINPNDVFFYDLKNRNMKSQRYSSEYL